MISATKIEICVNYSGPYTIAAYVGGDVKFHAFLTAVLPEVRGELHTSDAV